MITDKDRLDFIEERARLSRTGVVFVWKGGDVGYKYTEHRHIGYECINVREAIDAEIANRKWSGK